ncbi:hypothetical protein QTO34_007783 [Cnephaeus nilssonii]|uniref:Uncharacterized protein n=1 Tax=Cnephaeus nilssonii TaxID=3371016 RepID=A0AA40HJP4_CNENI|nr:hypothetical protein QTO34_007783 [Eptesicus nilssonii]
MPGFITKVTKAGIPPHPPGVPPQPLHASAPARCPQALHRSTINIDCKSKSLQKEDNALVYNELLKPGETVNTDRYRQQIINLNHALMVKQPECARRHGKLQCGGEMKEEEDGGKEASYAQSPSPTLVIPGVVSRLAYSGGMKPQARTSHSEAAGEQRDFISFTWRITSSTCWTKQAGDRALGGPGSVSCFNSVWREQTQGRPFLQPPTTPQRLIQPPPQHRLRHPHCPAQPTPFGVFDFNSLLRTTRSPQSRQNHSPEAEAAVCRLATPRLRPAPTSLGLCFQGPCGLGGRDGSSEQKQEGTRLSKMQTSAEASPR